MLAFLTFFLGATWIVGMGMILVQLRQLKDAQAHTAKAMADCRAATDALLVCAETLHDMQKLNAAILQSALKGIGQAPAQSAKTPAQIIPIRKVEETDADA